MKRSNKNFISSNEVKGGFTPLEASPDVSSGLPKLRFGLLIGLSVLILVLIIFTAVKATPPISPYSPGETLDPACSPTDVNCTVSGPITSLGPTGQGQTGTAQTLATSSDANIGLAITSAGNVHTFASQWLGTLGISRGGTGQDTWIAGRCVQVKADGTTLESATAACGTGGGGASRTLLSGIAAKCQSAVAGAGFSLPSSNAPTPTCGASGQQAYLSFAAGVEQTIYDRIELPADWAGTLKLVLTAWSAGTATPTINAALVCISTGATSNPTYGSNQSVSLTVGAGSGRSRSSTTLTTTGCAATDALYFKLAITANTTALNVLTAQLTE